MFSLWRLRWCWGPRSRGSFSACRASARICRPRTRRGMRSPGRCRSSAPSRLPARPGVAASLASPRSDRADRRATRAIPGSQRRPSPRRRALPGLRVRTGRTALIRRFLVRLVLPAPIPPSPARAGLQVGTGAMEPTGGTGRMGIRPLAGRSPIKALRTRAARRRTSMSRIPATTAHPMIPTPGMGTAGRTADCCRWPSTRIDDVSTRPSVCPRRAISLAAVDSLPHHRCCNSVVSRPSSSCIRGRRGARSCSASCGR